MTVVEKSVAVKDAVKGCENGWLLAGRGLPGMSDGL